MKMQDLDEAVGRIVKGVNTTVDVGPDEIKTQAAKFGNSVDKDGKPPTLSKKVKGKSTNVLYNLGMVKEDAQPRYTAAEWAIMEGGHTLEEPVIEPKKPGSLFTALTEGYKLQLERDNDLLVLHIKDNNTGKRTEVRGKPGYETNGYDPNDPLHQLLDVVGKSANISELMNGEVVTINPKHPDATRALAATDRAYKEAFDTDTDWVLDMDSGGIQVFATKVEDAYIELTYKRMANEDVYIAFSRGGRSSVTGEGGQNKIFGAVINHIKKWVDKNKPKRIVFSAFKPNTGAFGSQDTTRSSLYRKMVQRFASQNGYSYDVEDTGNEDTFILTRQNVDETRSLQPQTTPLQALVIEYLTFTSTGIMTIVSDGAKSPQAAEELKKVFQTLNQSNKKLQAVVNDKQKLETNKTAILKNIHDMMNYAIAHLKSNMIPQEFDSKKKQINSVLTKYNDIVKTESIKEAVEPNFDFEWEEAERYPEFVKIGKEAWIELAKKGKAVTITSAKGINNTDAADPDSFKSLDKDKQARALAQLKSGTVEMPIVAVYSDGWKELIGGNTRLTAMLAQDGKATIWVFKVPDEVAELAENFLGKIKGALGLGWSKIGDTVRGSMILNYLDSQNFDASQNLKKRIKSSKFKLIELDLETAKKYRDYTDKKVAFGGSMIDPDKEMHSRQWKLTHDSLIKSPPVLMSDGDILDGNHRLDRAIKLELPKIPVLMQVGKSVEENFADGKKPGRKGLAKRSGVNTKASVSSLRKTAKNSSGEKQRMAHWLANMKAGRQKAKKK